MSAVVEINRFRNALAFALLIAAGGVYGQTVMLPAGTLVQLELQHHISSALTPADAPVYFRVVDDVMIDGQPVIRRGTVVTGQMDSLRDRGAVAKGGRFTIGVRYIPSVDGQQIRVTASARREGLDRDNALVGWTVFWGVGGLLTHGNNAYVLRGATLEAEVVSDRSVEVTAPVRTNSTSDAPSRVATILGHRLGKSKKAVFTLNLDRDHEPRSLTFDWGLPEGLAPNDGVLEQVDLVAVNGKTLPASVAAVSTDEDRVTFDAWAIGQYCQTGSNRLEFRAVTRGGEVLSANDNVQVNIVTKAAM